MLDFGIARVRLASSDSEPTHTGRAMGTPAFMAPEQALGRAREVDERTDVCAVRRDAVHAARRGSSCTRRRRRRSRWSTRRRGRRARSRRSRPSCRGGDRASSTARWPSSGPTGGRPRRDARRARRGVRGALRREALSRADRSAQRPRRPLDARVGADAGRAADPAGPPGARRPRRPPRCSPRRARARVAGSGPGRRCAVAVVAAWFSARRDGPAPAPQPSVAVAQPTCTAASCAAGGARAVCRRGACVPLESADCTVLARPEDVGARRHGVDRHDVPDARPHGPGLRRVDPRRRARAPRLPGGVERHPGRQGGRRGSPHRHRASATTAWTRCAPRGTWPTTWACRPSSGSRAARRWSIWRSRSSTRAGSSSFAANTATMLSSIPRPPARPRLVWRVSYAAPMLAAAVGAAGARRGGGAARVARARARRADARALRPRRQHGGARRVGRGHRVAPLQRQVGRGERGGGLPRGHGAGPRRGRRGHGRGAHRRGGRRVPAAPRPRHGRRRGARVEGGAGVAARASASARGTSCRGRSRSPRAPRR